MAAKVALAGTINTGQDCTAATRVYVAQSLRKKVEEALVEAIRATKIGDPFDDDTLIGPLISANQRESVSGFVERARATNAKILTGGGVPRTSRKAITTSQPSSPMLTRNPRSSSMRSLDRLLQSTHSKMKMKPSIWEMM